MERKRIAVMGFGARGQFYSAFAENHPEKFELVAIIENNPSKIEMAKSVHKNTRVFSDYREFLKEKIPAHIVVIATQDKQHKDHAIAMMEAGYDLLLEKPVSDNKEDCVAIYKASEKFERNVIVCHVLRYSPFYSTIKNIIDEGKLGEVVSIHASENVGYYHQAHSFVRGPWRNKESSSPMILAKCCHDMDIFRYLMGEKCVSVNSYGGLYHFNRKNAPKDSAEYCSECKCDDCLYKAQKLYTMEKGRWCATYFVDGELSDENILKHLKKSQYDKCVYKNDNNVVDHQVTIMLFENGKTACHTMTAFSKDIYRDIKIYGTKAELVGNFEDNYIEIRAFGGDVEKINVDISLSTMGGHSGADYFMMCSLHDLLCGKKAQGVTFLDVSIESHLMCFAAEESRLNEGKTVFVSEF